MEKAPFSWTRKIADELSELDTIPLFGNAPPFNWSHFESLLSSSFNTKISLRPLNQEWKNFAEIKKTKGTHPLTVAIYIAPFGAPVFWTMPRADIDKLTSRMLYEKGKGKTSEIVREGFYHYLLLEALLSLQQMEPLQKATFQIEEETEISDETGVCIDIEIQIDDRTCWGTLLIPPSFQKKWIEFFSQTQSEYFPTETARRTELLLGIKSAETWLTQKEWRELQPGDFLLLHSHGYDTQGSTLATMHLGASPLFQLKITQNKIQLLDYAFIQEETMPSNNQSEEHLQPIEEETGSIKDIPLNVTIELARLRMTLDKLMHLSPGNLLELPIHPDQSVSLVVNGRKVGSGELIHLGETLGVRILEIGTHTKSM